MARLLLCLPLLLAAASATQNVTIFPGAEYSMINYDNLRSTLVSSVKGDGELCVAHSHDGAVAALSLAGSLSRCTDGVVLLGAAPPASLLRSCPHPVLLIAGSLDGVARFTRFAALRHVLTSEMDSTKRVSFAALRGASHHTFVGGELSSVTAQLDLHPTTDHESVRGSIAAVVTAFVDTSGNSDALVEAEHTAAVLSKPLTDALLLEGSTELGHPACNSDFPTNPSCGYTKWPDHSLPFGPAAAPSPPLPADCICGSPWVQQQATEFMADWSASGAPDTTLTTNDAYHDVSDTHPFHLPHIFNKCDSSNGACKLNTTSLTMPLAKAGDLFPNASDVPVSLYEFKSKIKSRQALWNAAGLDASSSVDTNLTICQDINQKAWDWAVAHAETETLAQFQADGEPFVMVADKKATIGATGPQWIADEMVYTRVSTADGASHIEIQSWYFPVSNTNGGSVPWFFPVGMHYCKLLSPARAMEWIYTDGLRARRGL